MEKTYFESGFESGSEVYLKDPDPDMQIISDPSWF
jgi:hypothetical protein